jgi:hypothetical protein
MDGSFDIVRRANETNLDESICLRHSGSCGLIFISLIGTCDVEIIVGWSDPGCVRIRSLIVDWLCFYHANHMPVFEPMSIERGK